MKPEVIVIGAGVVGLSIAFALQRRGLATLVLDSQPDFAEGTSGRGSFAWLNATAKVDDRRYHDLNRQGMAAFRTLAAEWGEVSIGLSASGSLHLSRASAGPQSRASLRREFDILYGWNYPVRWLDAVELRDAEPALVPKSDDAAFVAVEDRWLDTHRFLSFLRDRFIAAGGRLDLGHSVRSLRGRVSGASPWLETDRGILQADWIVLAAGARTDTLLEPLLGAHGVNRRITVQSKPGLLLETDPIPARLRLSQILHVDDDHWLHVRPTPDGGLLVASDDGDSRYVTEGECALPAIADGLLQRLAAYLRPECAEALRFRRHFIGIRPVPEDGKPVAGRVEGVEGVVLAATHSGMTLSLHLGECLAEEIATGRLSAALEPFRPSRFRQAS